jgi:hypothetical protein
VIHNAHKKSWSRESPEFAKAKTGVLYETGKQSKMIVTSKGRIDTCLCMADSLCCPPETIIALSIGCTPIQIKKFFKKQGFLKKKDFRQKERT